KPSLGPFALFGVWRRSWWVAAAVVVVASLLFGPRWLAWLTSMRNAEGGGLLYSSREIPMLLLPLVAWAFRTREGVPLPARLTRFRRGAPTPAGTESEPVAAKHDDADNPGGEELST